MRNDLVRTAFLLVLALAGCRGAEEGSDTNAARTDGSVQTSSLTGLYEGGEGPRRNQLCIVSREGRRTAFGLVTWSGGDTNCSGSGLAAREGDRLRLTMEGDESCAIDARIEGTRVTLPGSVPEGCAYYCGPGAQLTGAAFDKVGGSEQDARRAVDLVGDPLCG
jgi:hypothetical protein